MIITVNKKLVTTTLAFFTLLSLSWAQLRIHPTAGVNFSRYDEGYEDKEISGAAGLQAGLGIRFGDQIYIEPAILYFQTNNNVKIYETDAIDILVDERETKVRGLKIPVMIGVDLISDVRNALRVYGGPNLTYIADSNKQIFGNNENVEFKKTGWALGAGIGVDIGMLTLDLYHEWGMSDTFNDSSAQSRNNLLYLSVGLIL